MWICRCLIGRRRPRRGKWLSRFDRWRAVAGLQQLRCDRALSTFNERTQSGDDFARRFQSVQRRQFFRVHGGHEMTNATRPAQEIDRQYQQGGAGENTGDDSSIRPGNDHQRSEQHEHDEEEYVRRARPLGATHDDGLDIAKVEPFVFLLVIPRFNRQQMIWP
jgi:hypothetical protein